MAFAFFTRAGMAGMAMGLVDNVEPSRVQPGAQFRADRLGDAAHRVVPASMVKRPEADSLAGPCQRPTDPQGTLSRGERGQRNGDAASSSQPCGSDACQPWRISPYSCDEPRSPREP